MGEPASRRLVLMRHAKSDYPPGVADHDRPLNERGRRDAPAAGKLLGADGPAPDVVLCSSALRARQTWELVFSTLGGAAHLRPLAALYGAEVDDVVAIARNLADGVATALVIGHQPTMSRTALTLAGTGSVEEELIRIDTKFPTSAFTVLRVRGDWGELAPRTAVLERFEIPRG